MKTVKNAFLWLISKLILVLGFIPMVLLVILGMISALLKNGFMIGYDTMNEGMKKSIKNTDVKLDEYGIPIIE